MSKISPREIQLMRLAFAAAKASDIEIFDDWRKSPVQGMPEHSTHEDYVQFYADHNLDDRNDGGKLESPARVGNVNFGQGIECRLVVEKAQRDYKYWEQGDSKPDLKKAMETNVLDLIRDLAILKSDDRLSDDPQEAMAAVMREHNITLNIEGSCEIGPKDKPVFAELQSEWAREFDAGDVK